jgi:hypothetical protein
MDEAGIRDAVEMLVAGDVSKVSVVRSVSQSDLEWACGETTFELTNVAVIEVLGKLANGFITDSEAQLWASFVRRGFAEGSSIGAVRPLNIEWSIHHEDAIAEAISRLDELGDLIDGTIDVIEIRNLIAGLGGS